MKNKELSVGIKLVWFLTLAGILFGVLGAFLKIMHESYANGIFAIGFIASVSSWIIIVGDMFQSKITNKFFWIFSMVTFALITPIIYLIRRNELIINNHS